MNELRVRQLLIALAVGLLGLSVFLFRLSVDEHDLWRTRAGQNHWSFLGVPTQRGTIRLANGDVVAEDVPGNDIEFQYREFRRRHPVAAAVHGANLLRTALGEASWDSEAAFGFDEREDPIAAFDLLCRVDVGLLRAAGSRSTDKQSLPRYREAGSVEQDLRFYLASVVSGLSDWSFDQVHASLLDHREDRGTFVETLRSELRDALGTSSRDPEALRQELRRRFVARWDEFLALAVDIDELHAAERRENEPERVFVESLETARLESENEADTRILEDRDQRLVLTGDFWRFLAARERPYDRFRDWVADWGRDSVSAPERDLAEFAELRKTLSLELDAQIARTHAEIDDREHRTATKLAEFFELQRRKTFGVLLPDVDGYEPPPIGQEARSVPVLRRVDHQFAMRVRVLGVRHPGFRARPSVRRRVREGLGGLQVYIGSVSNYQLEDEYKSTLDRVPLVLDDTADLIRRLENQGALQHARARSETSVSTLLGDLSDSLQRLWRSRGRLGRTGVEAAADERLRGRSGVRFVDRDRGGHESTMHAMAEVVRGEDVTLTIDPDLQRIADSITPQLGVSTQRALVALDPISGDILALSGFGCGFESGPDGEKIRADGSYDLAATYPRTDPSIGSVIKPNMELEYLTGLREGRYQVDFDQFEVCKPSYGPEERYGSYSRDIRFGCDHSHGHVSRDPVRALAESCNIFFYECWNSSKATGPIDSSINEAMARRFDWVFGREPGQIAGLYDPFHCTPGEIPRTLTTGGGWLGRAPMVRTIGYDWRVSALDVAHAYAMVATGEKPNLGLIQERERNATPLGWHRDDLETVHRGLHECLRSGTAQDLLGRFRALGLAERAYAKTGTAFVDQVSGTRVPLYNAWFATFLGRGKEASLVVVAVAYRDTGVGAKAAGPMVCEFLDGIADRPELRARYFPSER